MFRGVFAKRGQKVVAVADVGSDSVGVCIAKLNEAGPAWILASERAVLQFEDRTKEQMISGVLSLLSETAEKALAQYSTKANPAPVSEAYAIIKEPWASSTTSRVATSFDKEELITDGMIAELARKAPDVEKISDRKNIFEAGVVRIELNGYPAKKPIGKHAHMIEIAALVSECEPTIRNGVTEALQKTFPGAEIALHSGIRALLSVFHDWASSPKPESSRQVGHTGAGMAFASDARTRHHFVVDVAGDSTNCVVIRKDIAAEHLATPEGVRTILKRVVGSGMTEEKISLMRMLMRDACSGPACDELRTSLSKAEPELARIFGETFSKLSAMRRLPNDLVLIVEPDLAPWLLKFFSRIDFCQFTSTTQPFAPTAVGQNDINRLAVPVPGVSIGAGLAVAVGFVNSKAEIA
ncbi:MAG TPA: hypothetical protein VJH69_03505 [Candidatus Paceibacterota bacterium]